MNTVNPLDWRRGWLTQGRIVRLRVALAAPEPTLRVIVGHHPPMCQPQKRKVLLRGARAGLSALANGRSDVVLSGHLHGWRAAPCAPDPARPTAMTPRRR